MIPIVGVTDSKQVFDNCDSTKQCSDERLRLDIAEIQESMGLVYYIEHIKIKWT